MIPAFMLDSCAHYNTGRCSVLLILVDYSLYDVPNLAREQGLASVAFSLPVPTPRTACRHIFSALTIPILLFLNVNLKPVFLH